MRFGGTFALRNGSIALAFGRHLELWINKQEYQQELRWHLRPQRNCLRYYLLPVCLLLFPCTRNLGSASSHHFTPSQLLSKTFSSSKPNHQPLFSSIITQNGEKLTPPLSSCIPIVSGASGNLEPVSIRLSHDGYLLSLKIQMPLFKVGNSLFLSLLITPTTLLTSSPTALPLSIRALRALRLPSFASIDLYIMAVFLSDGILFWLTAFPFR